jgi:hypothetical protein
VPLGSGPGAACGLRQADTLFTNDSVAAGWTAPAPGSHHYPEVPGGALVALFYLPAGRISYDIRPPRQDSTPWLAGCSWHPRSI